jgi:hypothetical protein
MVLLLTIVEGILMGLVLGAIRRLIISIPIGAVLVLAFGIPLYYLGFKPLEQASLPIWAAFAASMLGGAIVGGIARGWHDDKRRQQSRRAKPERRQP